MMPSADRIVIGGLSRVTVRVAQALVKRGATVVVVATRDDDNELIEALDPAAKLVQTHGSWVERLRHAQLDQSESLLALSEDDHVNLRIAAASHHVAPDVPVVLRAFDARLVGQFEAGRNVRRSFSASALAAPAFVASIFGEDVVETLRLANAEVPLCVLTLREDSPLVGQTPGQMKAQWSCAAAARARSGEEWEPARGDHGVLHEGDRLLVSGLLLDVLRLAQQNSGMLAQRRRSAWSRSGHRTPPKRGNLIPAAVAALLMLVVLTSVVFAVALDLSLPDALYKALRNELGALGLDAEPFWVKIFGILAAVGGAIVVGAILAHTTSLLTLSRLESQSGRRARRMRGHVVVAGLGVVGFVVDRLLTQLGIDTVIIEQTTPSRFREAASFRSPVLAGDVQLPENLERARIRDAACLVACTDNDLVNVTACVRARQMNPHLRTVARVFDEDLVETLTGFDIDVALSSSAEAASAFVGAATDERAIRRVELPGLDLIAFRHEFERNIDRAEIERWREQGLRVLAVEVPGEAPLPPTAAIDGLMAGTAAVVAGPEDVLSGSL